MAGLVLIFMYTLWVCFYDASW